MQSLSYMLWMKQMFNDFLVKNQKWILYVTKAYLIHDSYFAYVVEKFFKLELKNLV